MRWFESSTRYQILRSLRGQEFQRSISDAGVSCNPSPLDRARVFGGGWHRPEPHEMGAARPHRSQTDCNPSTGQPLEFYTASTH
jgi:hypothetical protein